MSDVHVWVLCPDRYAARAQDLFEHLKCHVRWPANVHVHYHRWPGVDCRNLGPGGGPGTGTPVQKAIWLGHRRLWELLATDAWKDYVSPDLGSDLAPDLAPVPGPDPGRRDGPGPERRDGPGPERRDGPGPGQDMCRGNPKVRSVLATTATVPDSHASGRRLASPGPERRASPSPERGSPSPRPTSALPAARQSSPDLCHDGSPDRGGLGGDGDSRVTAPGRGFQLIQSPGPGRDIFHLVLEDDARWQPESAARWVARWRLLTEVDLPRVPGWTMVVLGSAVPSPVTGFSVWGPIMRSWVPWRGARPGSGVARRPCPGSVACPGPVRASSSRLWECGQWPWAGTHAYLVSGSGARALVSGVPAIPAGHIDMALGRAGVSTVPGVYVSREPWIQTVGNTTQQSTNVCRAPAWANARLDAVVDAQGSSLGWYLASTMTSVGSQAVCAWHVLFLVLGGLVGAQCPGRGRSLLLGLLVVAILHGPTVSLSEAGDMASLVVAWGLGALCVQAIHRCQ